MVCDKYIGTHLRETDLEQGRKSLFAYWALEVRNISAVLDSPFRHSVPWADPRLSTSKFRREAVGSTLSYVFKVTPRHSAFAPHNRPNT